MLRPVGRRPAPPVGCGGSGAVPRVDMPGDAENAMAELVAALIHSRRTVLPRWLGPPGPDAAQLRLILDAAAAAPDHRQLLPWRFVLVSAAARARLGAAFAQALRERDPAAPADALVRAEEKAHHAPVLLLAVARLSDEAPSDATGSAAGTVVAPLERLVSAGCALQNMLLMAHALGFGAALTAGQAMASEPLRRLFALAPAEQALCFLSIGTPLRRPHPVQRPHAPAYVRVLGDASGVFDSYDFGSAN